MFISALGRGLTLPFLFIYLTDVRGLSDALAGLAIGWYGAVVLALSPLAGTLMDRYGARRVVLPSLAVEAAGTACLALVDGPVTAFGVATLVAAGGASVYSGQSVILSSLTADDERQSTFGLQFTLLNLGIGIGGLISGAVVDTARPGTFEVIYLVDGITFLAPLLILLGMPSAGRRLTGPASTGSGGSYLAVLRDRTFRRVVLFGLILTTCGYAQIEVGFAAYAIRVADTTPRIVAWALAANTVTIVVSQLLVLRFLHGRSRSRSLAAVGVIFAASWLILGAAGVAGREAPLLAAAGVILCSMVFASGETFLSPVLPAVTNALAPDALRGRYNAVMSINWGISGILGPVTAGPLIGAGGGALWVGLTVGGCLVASLIALSLRGLLTPAEDGRALSLAPALR
ncbi:MFS transporter [Catenuloplanes sp. NPDC051500]|uniref:MFS transporter n=1 Tax=Catenuloplanes sp. NPDC051500 TaxID=3363959 RepID=UPI0037949B54